MKKLVSFLLVALLLLSCVWVSASAETVNGLIYPTVYVRGKTDPIYNNLGTADEWMVSDSSRVFSQNVPDIKAYALKKAETLLPEFAAGMVTGNFDIWAEKMSTLLEPIYSDFVLDKNGLPREGSGIKTYDYNNLPKKENNGIYPLDLNQDLSNSCYVLEHDWRMSPVDNAEKLNQLINAILDQNHVEKVNLVTRCEGCCIALAYLRAYGGSKIANNVMLGSSANGVVYCSNIFAGKFNLTGDAVNRYVGRNFATDSDKSFGADLFGDDEALRTFLKETITMLSVTGAYDLPAQRIVELVNELAPKIYPSLMMSSYGTCPSYWAMVRHNDYEQAKKLCGLVDADGNPAEGWKAFVTKIDDYHYNVQQKAKELLKDLEEINGVTTAIAVKYGSETLPFIADCNEINDDTTLAMDASYGAVTAKIGETLTDEQLAGVDPAYISPDRMINAAAGLFPETTWYFKYYKHTEWGGALNHLTYDYIVSNGTLRIGDPGVQPRFQVSDGRGNSAQPMTEENANQHSDYYQTGKTTSILSFLTVLFPMLRRLIDWIKARLGK